MNKFFISVYSLFYKNITNFAPSFLNSVNMDLTISMNTVLNFLHSMELSTSNKQWLADHLYEEVKAEKAASEREQSQAGLASAEREQARPEVKAAATTHNSWPKIRREDMRISPEVMKLVEDIEPLPDDFDYDKARLDYLLKKHG